MTEKLAECYLDAPRNLNIPTTPGRQLWFNGGKATVFDERDITIVLRRDDLTIYPSERYRDWWPQWLSKCGEHQPARAKIEVNGVVHLPPYATLLAQAPAEADQPPEAQGPVPAAKRWVRKASGTNSPGVDSGGVEAHRGSDPLDPNIAWDDDHPH